MVLRIGTATQSSSEKLKKYAVLVRNYSEEQRESCWNLMDCKSFPQHTFCLSKFTKEHLHKLQFCSVQLELLYTFMLPLKTEHPKPRRSLQH